MSPEAFIAFVLAFHLNVPEPVRFEFSPGPVQFTGWKAKYQATIEGQANVGWLIRYDRTSYLKASNYHRQFVILHELCHAVYDYDVMWPKLADRERKERERRADRCAADAIRRMSKQ